MKKLKFIMIGLLAALSTKTLAQTKGDITLEQFVAKLKAAPNAQILDARSNEEFVLNHINGAVSADAKSPGYEQFISGLSKDKPTFVYAIANARSAILAKELRQKGFKQVYELPGGLSNWVGSGYPITSTTKKGVSLTTAQYGEFTNSAPLVLVDFASKYCGTCKKQVLVLDSLKAETGFAPKVISIEDYDNPKLALELKINALPTLVLYKNNKEVWRKSGLSSTAQIKAAVNHAQTKLAQIN